MHSKKLEKSFLVGSLLGCSTVGCSTVYYVGHTKVQKIVHTGNLLVVGGWKAK